MKRSIKVLLSILIIMAFTATSLGLTAVAVKSIKLNASSVKISVGKTYKLKVTFTPANATNKKVTFSSADKSIASVSSTGYIKGIKEGKTVITVISVSNKKAAAKCNVTISQVNNYSKHFEISWQGYNTVDLADNNWVQKKIEKMFNVTIKNNHGLDYVDREKQLLYMNTGEVNDVLFGPLTPSEYYNAGVVRPIPEDMVKKYAPLMYAELKLSPPALKQWRDKETGGFQALTTVTYQCANVYPFIRLDWLENVGMKPNWEIKKLDDRLYWSPETFTIEKFEKVLDAFTNKDPDKNGKNDTFGLVYHPDNHYGENIIIEAFGRAGSYPYRNTEVDGKAMDVRIAPYYKEFLKMMQRWYKEGYIDKDWVTNNVATATQKFINGNAGTFFQNAVVLNYNDYPAWPPKALFDKDPNAKILCFAPFKGPNGRQGTRQWLPVSVCGNYFNYVGKKVSDEKLARILQIYDYVNFSDEGYLMANFGEEGTHWEWSGEPYNSFIKRKSGVELYKTTGLKSYTNSTITKRQQIWVTSPNVSEIIKFENKNPGIIAENYTQDIFGEFSKELQALGEKYQSIGTTYNEFRANAITGKLSIDAEWDGYVQKLLNNGMREYNELFNKFPKVKDLKAGE